MKISLIAAVSENGVIGYKNELPWSIPEDLKYFQTTTLNKIIIMGRKTFESIGKPLPKRLNIIISRQKNFQAPEGCRVFSSIGDCLSFCQGEAHKFGEEVFVVGGGELYNIALPYADRLYITEVHKRYEGDAQFPEFDKNQFQEVSRRAVVGDPSYSFVVYEKIKKEKI